MKSIRAKITLCLILTVLTALVAVGLSSIIPNYNSTITTVDHMMSETAVLAAERVEQELMAYKNVAIDAGCIPQLSDPSISTDEKNPLSTNVPSCIISSEETSLALTASAFLMEKIILTANMSGRPCRAMSMYRNL